MIDPRRLEKTNSGRNVDAVNTDSIDSEFLMRLSHINAQLKKAIDEDDRRSVVDLMGCLSRLRYHPALDHGTLVPLDVLLLPKESGRTQARSPLHSAQSQPDQRRFATVHRKQRQSTPKKRTTPK